MIYFNSTILFKNCLKKKKIFINFLFNFIINININYFIKLLCFYFFIVMSWSRDL